MADSYNTFTDKQLIDRREEIERELEQRRHTRRVEMLRKVLKCRPQLLELMTHDRTSCATCANTYYHPEHGGAGCNKCCLEQLTVEDTDIEIAIDIRLRRVTK